MTAISTAVKEASAIARSFKGKAIDGRNLRLHTVGDCATIDAALTVSNAVQHAWYDRGGGKAWTYTHAATTVPRPAWGNISVLGSIDDLTQLESVLENGYAPARYMAEFPNGKRSFVEQGIRWIPCPAQTGLEPTEKHKVSTTYESIEGSCPSTCKLKETRECYGMHGHVGLVTRRLDKDHGAILVEASGNAKLQSCVDCGLCLDADKLYARNMGIVFSAHGVKAKSMKKRLTVLS